MIDTPEGPSRSRTLIVKDPELTLSARDHAMFYLDGMLQLILSTGERVKCSSHKMKTSGHDACFSWCYKNLQGCSYVSYPVHWKVFLTAPSKIMVSWDDRKCSIDGYPFGSTGSVVKDFGDAPQLFQKMRSLSYIASDTMPLTPKEKEQFDNTDAQISLERSYDDFGIKPPSHIFADYDDYDYDPEEEQKKRDATLTEARLELHNKDSQQLLHDASSTSSYGQDRYSEYKQRANDAITSCHGGPTDKANAFILDGPKLRTTQHLIEKGWSQCRIHIPNNSKADSEHIRDLMKKYPTKSNVKLYLMSSTEMLNNEYMKTKVQCDEYPEKQTEKGQYFSLVYLDYTRACFRQPDLNALWENSYILHGTLAITCPSHNEIISTQRDHHRKTESDNLIRVFGIDVRFERFDFSGLFKVMFEVNARWDAEYFTSWVYKGYGRRTWMWFAAFKLQGHKCSSSTAQENELFLYLFRRLVDPQIRNVAGKLRAYQTHCHEMRKEYPILFERVCNRIDVAEESNTYRGFDAEQACPCFSDIMSTLDQEISEAKHHACKKRRDSLTHLTFLDVEYRLSVENDDCHDIFGLGAPSYKFAPDESLPLEVEDDVFNAIWVLLRRVPRHMKEVMLTRNEAWALLVAKPKCDVSVLRLAQQYWNQIWWGSKSLKQFNNGEKLDYTAVRELAIEKRILSAMKEDVIEHLAKSAGIDDHVDVSLVQLEGLPIDKYPNLCTAVAEFNTTVAEAFAC